MNLLIKGFSKQQVIQVEQVALFIKTINPQHLLGIVAIVYDPDFFYQRSYVEYRPVNYQAAGLYSKSPVDHILVHKFKTERELKHIILHEIGHHVFTKILTSQQRKKWVTEVYPKLIKPSEYAKRNANEGFSEAYAFRMPEVLDLLA